MPPGFFEIGTDTLLDILFRLLVNTRVRQGLNASSREDFFELQQQRFVDQTVRCQGLAAVDFKRRSVEATNLASGFFDNKHARGCVPGIEIELPKAVEASAGYIAQIERC